MEKVIVIKINKTHGAQRVSHSENKCFFQKRRRGIYFSDFVCVFGGKGGGGAFPNLGAELEKALKATLLCVWVFLVFFTGSLWNR